MYYTKRVIVTVKSFSMNTFYAFWLNTEVEFYIKFDLLQNPEEVIYFANQRVYRLSFDDACELIGDKDLSKALEWYGEMTQAELYKSEDGLHHQPEEEPPLGLKYAQLVIENESYSYLPNPGVFVPFAEWKRITLDSTVGRIKGKCFFPEEVFSILFKDKLTDEQWTWVLKDPFPAIQAKRFIEQNEAQRQEQLERDRYDQVLKNKLSDEVRIAKNNRSYKITYKYWQISRIDVRGQIGYSWSPEYASRNLKKDGMLGEGWNESWDYVNENLVKLAIQEWKAEGKPEYFLLTEKDDNARKTA